MPHQSEYRHKYRGDYDGSGKENYKEMLRVRYKRKSHELRHTPLIWLDENGKMMDEESNRSDENVCNQSSTQSDITEEVTQVIPLHQSKSVQVETDLPVKKVDVAVQSPSRRFHNRNSKTTRRRSVKCSSSLKLHHEKPIIAYGWADNTSLQKKMTFNVKAPSTDVRLTALRAARHRECQKSLRMDKKQRLIQEKMKNKALIESLTNFDEWQTEYQKQFCK